MKTQALVFLSLFVLFFLFEKTFVFWLMMNEFCVWSGDTCEDFNNIVWMMHPKQNIKYFYWQIWFRHGILQVLLN